MPLKPHTERRHLLTVLLEDYFHVGAFNGLIERDKWYRFEPRFEKNTLKTLDFLDRFGIKATFFVLGWVAEKQPDLVREVARRGHEIGSRGYYHRSLRHMSSGEFRTDLARSREALERACGKKIFGYRAARRLILPADSWALDVLAQEGYTYDSSVLPTVGSLRANPSHRFAYRHRSSDSELWEFPIPTTNLLGVPVPILGGNYSRQIPHTILRHVVQHWHQSYEAPLVLYFHVWELDPGQPRISGASPLMRLRHYRGLDKMSWLLEEYFRQYRFSSFAEYLGLGDESSELATAADPKRGFLATVNEAWNDNKIAVESEGKRTPITIVVPCYNEESALPYLSNTLKSVQSVLQEKYDVEFVFVDDGSTDSTRDRLNELFGHWAGCRVIIHDRNKGVAVAILTGISSARTDIVCSIDCDCTYDPHELWEMVPKLTAGVDLVTASPYHPLGQVRNVPSWRLALSKTSSWLYRRVLRQKLFTYTSCFRVYRRTSITDLQLDENGFLGIAEMVGRLDLKGAKVVEHPATLEVRLFGYSKMKTVKTIAGHLRLLSRLLSLRLRSDTPDKTGERRPEEVAGTESRL
jgi:polysaccharide deacetylase family protein (PEP-CTERM system associated)